MDDKLYRLNTTYAIVDTIKCLAFIAAFAFAGWAFARWWINLFSILALLTYSTHTLVINEDIECMKEQEGDHGYDK